MDGTGSLLSTCKTTVASECPRGLVALQMYWPESCWATLGMIRVLPSSRCCQGSGARSLDQWMVGVGLPVPDRGRGQRLVGCPRDHVPGRGGRVLDGLVTLWGSHQVGAAITGRFQWAWCNLQVFNSGLRHHCSAG